MSLNREHPGNLPLLPMGFGASSLDFDGAEDFWQEVRRMAAEASLGDNLDIAMAGESSPRIWLFLHEPGQGALSAAAALVIARELASRDQAVLILDCDDNQSRLTRWAGRHEDEGWIDMVRYGASVLTSGVALPFQGRRAYILGVGSFTPTDVEPQEAEDLINRLKRQADDLVLVAPADSLGKLWGPLADIRLLCWDRARKGADIIERVCQSFEEADCQLTGLIGFGLPDEGMVLGGKDVPAAETGTLEPATEEEADRGEEFGDEDSDERLEAADLDDVDYGDLDTALQEMDTEDPAEEDETRDLEQDHDEGLDVSGTEFAEDEDGPLDDGEGEKEADEEGGQMDGEEDGQPEDLEDAEEDDLEQDEGEDAYERYVHGEEEQDEPAEDEAVFAADGSGTGKGSSRVFWGTALISFLLIIVVGIYYFKVVRVPQEETATTVPVVTAESGPAATTGDQDQAASPDLDEPAEPVAGSAGDEAPGDLTAAVPADSTALPAAADGDAGAGHEPAYGGSGTDSGTEPGQQDGSEGIAGDMEQDQGTPGPTAEPEAEPEPAAPRFTVDPYLQPVGTDGWALHLFSFPDSLDAGREASRLKRRGFQTEVRAIELKEKGRWFRVYVGSFLSKKEALEARDLLLKELRLDWARPTEF
jgi:cell division protein FtsN